jgi:D-alanyl-D-alanine carboxypeptidase (penicillin-binding protein 5/6)
MRSGQFLAGAEQDTPLAVGSLMKLLAAQTAYAAGDPVKVAVAPPGLIVDPEESRIGIGEGQELSRDLLVRAMLIVSANDAARMLAIDIAGGEAQFADLMNQQAGALGLTNTHAVNVTGLDQDGQYSSAADLSRLGAFLMGNQTFQLTVKRTSASLNGKTIPSTNDLLEKYPGADGIKTGHTTSAAWCITASALRDGRRIIVTVLGAPSEEARDAGATALLDWAFQQP